jgi:acetyl-CoA synthetase
MSVSQGRDKAVPGANDHYAAMHGGFRWPQPARFNIAEVCCRRWATDADGAPDDPERIAIIDHSTLGSGAFHTYSELQQGANRLSNVLQAQGVRRGDRVAIVLPQRFETAVAYIAVLQMGAVAMPLSILFGPEALEFRLQDSEAVLAICDEASIGAVQGVRARCPQLRAVIGIGAATGADLDAAAAMRGASPDFALADTQADDPAVLIYTSGTTGNPKGALIPHRAMIGNLSGFICSQNWFGFDPQAWPTLADVVALEPAALVTRPASQAIFWSPADWAWTGGLMDALLPTLYFGRPIVAWNGRFSPELAFSLMQQHGVTHSFLFPTALKAMMKAVPEPRKQYAEAAGPHERWRSGGRRRFRLVPRRAGRDGQRDVRPDRDQLHRRQLCRPVACEPGSMGKGYPGHRVAVIDDDGQECPVGVPGDVALNRFDVHGDPDPIFFLGYWKNEAATAGKFTGDWCRTGDVAVRDADGYLWYQGRADDVFKAAGYRIGPGEIENCLVKHPAVANAAVVPKPDRERGATCASPHLPRHHDLRRAGRRSRRPRHPRPRAGARRQLHRHRRDVLGARRRRRDLRCHRTIIGNWFASQPRRAQKVVLATKVAGPSRGMDWVRAGSGT